MYKCVKPDSTPHSPPPWPTGGRIRPSSNFGCSWFASPLQRNPSVSCTNQIFTQNPPQRNPANSGSGPGPGFFVRFAGPACYPASHAHPLQRRSDPTRPLRRVRPFCPQPPAAEYRWPHGVRRGPIHWPRTAQSGGVRPARLCVGGNLPDLPARPGAAV